MVDKKNLCHQNMLSIDGIEHYRLPAAWQAVDNLRNFAMVKAHL